MQPVENHNGSRRALYELDASKLILGEPVPGSLLTADGRIILRAGKVLEPEFLNRLQRRLANGLFGGSEWSTESHLSRPRRVERSKSRTDDDTNRAVFAGSDTGRKPKNLISIAVDSLHPGTRLTCNLYTCRGALLLPEGSQITYRLLCKLREYRIFEVQFEVPASNAQSQATPSSSESRAARRRKGLLKRTHNRRPRLHLSDLRAEIDHGRSLYKESVNRVREMLKDAFLGRRSSAPALCQIVTEFLDFAHLDASVLPGIVQLGDTPTEYLYQHGLNVALMSMAAACELKLSDEETVQVGLGALVQDLGMLCIPRTMRLAPRSLTKAEQLEIQRHPIYSVDLLQRLDVAESSMMIAYQSHERPDRSGYPKGRHRMLIHPFARIVGAADAYVALSSQRPHRDGRIPYQAMTTLLEEANRDRHDRDAVRTILDCLSLFPLGSYVNLSNGSRARVLRANPGLHTRPVVLQLNADGTDSDVEIDLSLEDDLNVAKAIPAPAKTLSEPMRTGLEAVTA